MNLILLEIPTGRQRVQAFNIEDTSEEVFGGDGSVDQIVTKNLVIVDFARGEVTLQSKVQSPHRCRKQATFYWGGTDMRFDMIFTFFSSFFSSLTDYSFSSLFIVKINKRTFNKWFENWYMYYVLGTSVYLITIQMF